MLPTRCACGVERLADEEVTDHLLAVFEPQDATGTDGQIHEEIVGRACSCGFRATSGKDLDTHFLAVFTAANAVGNDGGRHVATDGT